MSEEKKEEIQKLEENEQKNSIEEESQELQNSSEQEASELEDSKGAAEEEKELDLEESEQIQEEPQEKPKSDHDELISRVNDSKAKAESVYQEYLNINQELDEKSTALIEQENNIVNTTVANSLELLKALQVDSLQDEIATINEITLDNKEELMSVKYPSKGTFKGLTFGILTTVAVVAGAFGIGAKLANLPLNVDTLLQKSSWDSVSELYANLLNLKQIPSAGYIAIGAVSLLFGLIAYKTVKWIQKRKNINYVNALEENTKEYIANLEDKNAKIEELIKHLENIKLVMQKYDVILQEQNAKIKRMLFIEQPENINSLQRASKLEVDKTVLILDELLKLMNTPISDDIDIREDSKNTLKSANIVINEVIRKLYI